MHFFRKQTLPKLSLRLRFLKCAIVDFLLSFQQKNNWTHQANNWLFIWKKNVELKKSPGKGIFDFMINNNEALKKLDIKKQKCTRKLNFKWKFERTKLQFQADNWEYDPSPGWP